MKSQASVLIFFCITLSLLFCQVSSSFSQEKNQGDAPAAHSFIFAGVIINKSDSTPVAFAHLVILNTADGAVCNNEGQFKISMSVKDTLLVSAIGYKKGLVFFSDNISGGLVIKDIFIEPVIYEIREVVVMQYHTYNEFRTAVLNVHEPEIRKPDIRINIPSEVEGSSVNSMALISMLYERFSMEGKARREVAVLTANENYRSFIDNRYNPGKIQRITGIVDSVKMKRFVEFCGLTDLFIEKSSEYDLIAAILECYEKFETEEE